MCALILAKIARHACGRAGSGSQAASFLKYSRAGCGHQALSIQIKPCKSATNWEQDPLMENIGQP